MSRRVPDGLHWWEPDPDMPRDQQPPVRLELTVRDGGGPSSLAVIATLTGELKGWVLRGNLQASTSGLEVDQLVLQRGPDGATIGSKKLRSMGFGEVVDAAARMLEDARASVYLGPEWARRVRRPGRRGADPRVYAVLAARYVRALRASPKAPYREMVREAAARGEYETEVALRAAVRRARRLPEPVLTPAVSGRAGGELTEYGKQLAREMGEEV